MNGRRWRGDSGARRIVPLVMQVADIHLAQLRIELGRLPERPMARSAQERRDRDRVQMQAHAKDESRYNQPVQDRKPPFGAPEQDRPRERLMDQGSLNFGVH